MILYHVTSGQVLARANVAKRECTTRGQFGSCDLEAADSRRSRLSVLVDDLEEGEWREYGCNISMVRPAGLRVELQSWSLPVQRSSKCL